MHPVATTLEFLGHSRPIGSYGVALALAVLIAGLMTLSEGRRQGLDPGALVATFGPAVLGAGVGAFALSTAVALARGVAPTAALMRPGLVFYGGAFGGLLAGAISAQRLRVPALRWLDAVVVPLAVAHAIGRVGCLLGGCCYGRPSQLAWAVRSHHPLAPMGDGLLRHPVQLYAAAGLLVLALGLHLTRPRLRTPGVLFLAYVGAYAALRCVLEAFRGDGDRGVFWLGLSTAQLISLALLLAVPVCLRRLRAHPVA